MQVTIISKQIKNIPVKIASIYCPLSYKINSGDFDKFFQLMGHSFTAGGNYYFKNSLWGSRTSNPRWLALHRSLIKNLSSRTLILLTYIFNSMLRLSYLPEIWKFAVIILIPKLNKPRYLFTWYRPISLLLILGKLFEKTLFKRLRLILQKKPCYMVYNQFECRSRHSTIQQVHRLTDEMSTTLKSQQYCTGLFLDIAQAFDRVWHEDLLYK